jgi:hypothetical protein
MLYRGEIFKNLITGSNIASWTLVCLKNRQADPPRNSRRYPRYRRFLLIRIRVIQSLFRVDAPSQKIPAEDFTP